MKCVYVCITDKCMRTMDDVKKTRKYKKAQEVAQWLRIDKIVVDICSSWNRKKPKLNEVLREEGNIIVVTDMTALGKNEEIATVYQDIIKNNDILVCYFNKGGLLEADEMSTVDISFEKKSRTGFSPQLKMATYMSPTQYRQNSSRMVDPRIIEAYWEIEKGGRSQREIVKALESSTNTFLRRIREYVGTDGWVERYVVELETSDIGSRPTRLGTVSEDAKKLYEFLEAHPDYFEAYSIEVVASFAGIDLETWERIGQLEEEENQEEATRLRTRYYVNACHLYRQVLKYRKYLKRLKYRQ